MKTNIPEIGKTYAFFDDGKTGLSRRYKATVLDIIPSNVVEKFCPELFAGWKENLKAADFLYAPITDFFIKCSIPKYDDSFVYFVRDKTNGWFSIDYPHAWTSGLLDVDGEYGRKNDVPPVAKWVAGKDYWEVDMTIRVHNHELEYSRWYFNVHKVEEIWNGFRLYFDNGAYQDFNKDCTWERI